MELGGSRRSTHLPHPPPLTELQTQQEERHLHPCRERPILLLRQEERRVFSCLATSSANKKAPQLSQWEASSPLMGSPSEQSLVTSSFLCKIEFLSFDLWTYLLDSMSQIAILLFPNKSILLVKQWSVLRLRTTGCMLIHGKCSVIEYWGNHFINFNLHISNIQPLQKYHMCNLVLEFITAEWDMILLPNNLIVLKTT